MATTSRERSPWLSFGGAYVSIRLDAAETSGRYTLIESRKPAGSITPIHAHLGERIAIVVIEGVLSVQTRDGIRELRANEALTLARGETQRLANRSFGDVRYLQLFRGAGFETLLRELGDPVVDATAPPPPMSDAKITRLKAVALEHGVRLLPADALPPIEDAQRLDSGKPLSSFDLIGIEIDVIEEWGDEDGDLALIGAVFPPGSIVPLHSHREPEAFYILSGHLDVFLEGAEAGWRTAGPGTVVNVPAQMRHAVRNAGDGPCAALTVTQRRLVRFFKEGARPAGSPKGPPLPQEVRNVFEVAQRFGYWNGSVADNEAIGIKT